MVKGRKWYHLLISLPAILASALPIVFCPLCWPLYTALLTAMGVEFFNYTPVLLPLIIIFIVLALIGYWLNARKTKNYWPLIIGILSGLLIIFGKFVLSSTWMLWTGIIGLLAASILHYFSKKPKKEIIMSNYEEIDPALKSMKDFSRVSKSTIIPIQKMRNDTIFSEGTLPAKIKVSMALIWSISAKCEPCLKYYAVKAKEHDLSEEELGELLAVGSTMGGCVGEMWCLKAYHAFKQSEELKASCCEIH